MIAITTSSSISVKARVRGMVFDTFGLTGLTLFSLQLASKNYSLAESALPAGAFPLNFSAHGPARFI
jgi:hypothetical protein